MSRFSLLSGFMSHQQIRNGDPVVLYFLLPSQERARYLNAGNLSLSSMTNTNSLFQSIALPIMGVYDEYKVLKEIVKDDNVKNIEKTLGAPIEKVLSRVGDRRESFSNDENIENLMNAVSICMEHLEIFNEMVNVDKKNREFGESDINYAAIEMLGFVQTESLKDRFFRKYELESRPDAVLYSDDTFARLEINGKDIPRLYRLKDLIEHLNLDDTCFDGETESSLFIRYAEKVNSLGIEKETSEEEYDLLVKISKIVDKEGFSKDSENYKLLEQLKEIERKSNIGHFTEEEKRKNESYLNISKSIRENLELINKTDIFKQDRESLINHRHFISAMIKTSSLFMPTYSSYNDCESSYHKELYSLVEKFVK